MSGSTYRDWPQEFVGPKSDKLVLSLVKMPDAAQPSSLALLPEGEGNAQCGNGLPPISTSFDRTLNMGPGKRLASEKTGAYHPPSR